MLTVNPVGLQNMMWLVAAGWGTELTLDLENESWLYVRE